MSYYAGLDVGSLSTDAVIIDQAGDIVAHAIISTGANSTKAAERAMAMVLAECGQGSICPTFTVATGYGRASVPFADKTVTEITCHALGAFRLMPGIGTIIDIGGQDSKVIEVGDKGRVLNFNMNDKCAAGTGRFLEIMAARLELDLDDLGPSSLASQRALEISSVCTVFAESEVVTLVARNEPREDIIHGLHRAIVNRIYNMVRMLGVKPRVAMTGGVAKNAGVVALMEAKIGQPIIIPPEPQIVGAYGAALTARNQAD